MSLIKIFFVPTSGFRNYLISWEEKSISPLNETVVIRKYVCTIVQD